VQPLIKRAKARDDELPPLAVQGPKEIVSFRFKKHLADLAD
jgi:hypothetical protein